jgi:hypothetical protein
MVQLRLLQASNMSDKVAPTISNSQRNYASIHRKCRVPKAIFVTLHSPHVHRSDCRCFILRSHQQEIKCHTSVLCTSTLSSEVPRFNYPTEHTELGNTNWLTLWKRNLHVQNFNTEAGHWTRSIVSYIHLSFSQSTSVRSILMSSISFLVFKVKFLQVVPSPKLCIHSNVPHPSGTLSHHNCLYCTVLNS